MTHFDCGCETDPAGSYCDEHLTYSCHTSGCPPDGCGPDCPVVNGECPPCRLSRLRSVSLSPKATPTRRGAA